MLESLAWCFFSPRGRLTRQELALALLAILTVRLLLEHLVDWAVFGADPFADHSPEELLQRQQPGRVIPALLLTWPILAVILKRLHDLGRTYRSLVVWLATSAVLGYYSTFIGTFVFWSVLLVLVLSRGGDEPEAAASAGSSTA